MDAMLELEVLRRPNLSPPIDFSAHVQRYSLKFVLDGIPMFVAFAICGLVPQAIASSIFKSCSPLRCQCTACLRSWEVREKYYPSALT